MYTIKQYLKQYQSNYNSARSAKILGEVLAPSFDGTYTREVLDDTFNANFREITFRPSKDMPQFIP
jgi:hypothetical protein